MKYLKCLLIICVCIMIFIVQNGCHSDVYYKDKAVAKARDFLLENAPELTTEQIYYVKYSPPVLLNAPIFNKGVISKKDRQYIHGQELKQICISWKIPNQELTYMVYGVSDGRMDYWYPERLIRKEFEKSDVVFDKVKNQSQEYIKNYLYAQLSVEEYNITRFNNPTIEETNFPLAYDYNGQLSEEEIKKNKEQLKNKKQYSVVWKFSNNPQTCVVICGTATNENLSDWKINSGNIIKVDELNNSFINSANIKESK